jgi:hypothetical protein
MSFSYKTLSSNDISLTSYIANKQWEINDATLYQNGITIYIGENLPIDRTNPFDPINDSETANEEYRRLIYASIKNLYYQNYTSGSLTGQFFHSSSFFNYEQSTLTSGSMLAANRNIPTITGSSALGNNPTLFETALYDISSSLYDETTFDPDQGSKIVVISVDQNIFGSGLTPKSISISGSTYNIQDDGEGNLLDTLATSSLYVGNVFYSQGLIVITDQDYLCIFGAPPTSVNDYFSYQNTEYASQTLDILANDFADCGAIDPSSVQLMSVPGYSFPNYTSNNGIITITPDQTSVIPGSYKLNYVIETYGGIISNTSSINLEVTALPLQITNLISSSVCFGSTASVPVTFSINYGVPPYSYSLNQGTTYTGISGFFNKTASGSITASNSNVIYVKDYTNTVYSASFNSWYPGISYTTSIIQLPCSSTSNNGRVTILNDGTNTATSASIDGGSYFALPKSFTGLSTGSHTIAVKNSFNCITSSIVTLGIYPALTASVTQSNVSCYGGSNGSITVAFTNVTDTLIVNMTDATGSDIYSNVNLSSFPNNTVTASGLVSGSYNLSMYALGSNQCQSYSNTFTLTSPTTLSFNATASYINSCSNAISFSAAGGTSPYYYYAYETGSNILYSSDTSSVTLNGLNSGSYNAFVVDSNGCTSATSSIQVFGRTYTYSGSYCVTASGQNTGYISSSKVIQVFNSGPYSGSLVTSSYSSGSSLFGPKVNFTSSFISGSPEETGSINVLSFCEGLPFYRYYQNTASCAVSGCFAPTLLTATPVSCSNNWQSKYSITYNSSSANSTYTIIQYGPYSNFGNYASHIITNAVPLTLPLSYFDDSGTSVQPNDIMYFRAYNSCSNGATSSYSNVITASCAPFVPPPPAWEGMFINVVNDSGNQLKTRTPNSSLTNTYISTINDNSSLSFYYEGTSNGFSIAPWIEIGMIGFNQLSQVTQDSEGNSVYNVEISSTDPIDGGIYTTCKSLIDPTNYPNVSFITNYESGNNNFNFSADTSFANLDLRIEIDRENYTPGSTITLILTPAII